MKKFTLAAIDIGTNTVRLLVVEADNPANYRPLYHEQEITRLGEGLAESGELRPEAMARTLKVLAHYARQAARRKADEIYAVATSAVREAGNGEDFVVRVKHQTGLEITVIPPRREAELALMGVQSVIHPGQRPLLVIDIGGGSTEFIQAEEKRINDLLSLKMGVVKLKEQFLKSDPVKPLEYQMMWAYIQQALEEVVLHTAVHPLLVGTAGTVTTLAAVDQELSRYDPRKINNYVLKKERIQAIQDRFLRQTPAQRRQTPGLEPGRADVIVAGTALLLCFLEKFGFDQLVACDSGLREGIVLSRLKHHFLRQAATGG
jgi:exopolyphosphatase/guanosine-5'-triphosphate,3'-diphosphate pyrophosphatase